LNYAEQQRNPSRHLVSLTVVVVIHIGLGYALVNGLARKIVEVVKAPIETKIIEEVKPPEPPPPENLPPPPKIAPPPPSFVPPPEVVVSTPPVAQPTITATQTPPPATPVTIAPPPAAAAPAAPQAARPAIANVKACAPREEDYPPAAARAEATGTTKVRFSIDGQGALVKAEVVKSAGGSREHKLLDRTAVEKLSTCKFVPGTDENGRPAGGSFDVEYVWKLQ
jgi:protein TonB